MKRKKLSALLMALLMLVCTASPLQAQADLFALTPFADLVTAAAVRVGESPETILEEGTLSQSFVYNYFLFGQKAEASLGITPEMLTDPALQAEYLSKTFYAKATDLSGILSLEEDYGYIGVRVMATNPSENGQDMTLMGDVYQAENRLDLLTEEQYDRVQWLDRRAVITFRQDAAAPMDWKLVSFSVDAELDMEQATSDYFSENMVEYMNPEMGFSLLYPALFAEDTLQELPDGIAATLPDGTASFFARRMINGDGWTVASILDGHVQQTPQAEVTLHEVTGAGRCMVHREDGFTVVDHYQVSGDWVYQLQVVYHPSLAKDFSLYCDYMFNSFNADDLGVG